MDVDVGVSTSKDYRSEVLSLLRSQTGYFSSRKRTPTIILFIDEIDRAPIPAIKDVLEIAGAASRETEDEEEGLIEAGPYNCNVIVIGAANDRLYCEKVGMPYDSQKCIFRCCFKPYKTEQLIDILMRRTQGLFDKPALTMISCKVANAGGDVRFLLQLADSCLTETTRKFRRMIDQREEYEACTHITRIPNVHQNPLENWDDEVTEIIPIVEMKHVCEVSKSSGWGPLRETVMISDHITDGARALLVAMICYGKTDTVSSLKGFTHPAGLNLSEIRQSLQTYITIKEQFGVKIGHDPSVANVVRWVRELHDAALLNGGLSTFGGSRSFQWPRKNQDINKVSMVAITVYD